MKRRNAEPCTKKKLNLKLGYPEGVNKLAKKNKKRTKLMLIYFCKKLFTLKVKYFVLLNHEILETTLENPCGRV